MCLSESQWLKMSESSSFYGTILYQYTMYIDIADAVYQLPLGIFNSNLQLSS